MKKTTVAIKREKIANEYNVKLIATGLKVIGGPKNYSLRIDYLNRKELDAAIKVMLEHFGHKSNEEQR